MTVKEKLIQMHYELGMFQDQARDAVENAIPTIEQASEDYQITWDRPADEYPSQFYAIMMMIAKPKILEWIDKNIPQAWYRGIFEDSKTVNPA